MPSTSPRSSIRRARPSRRRESPGQGESLGVLAETLTSTQNALVKRAASLRQRKFREREGAFLVEGADLVAAGLAAGRRPQVVFVRAERAEEIAAALGLAAGGDAGAPGPAVYPVLERVAARIATLETPPDALAVFPLPERRPLELTLGRASAPKGVALRREAGERATAVDASLVLYLDAVQDPGNVGALLRAAVAFGAAALVTSPGCADLYNPKTVRASMGAVFGLPLLAEAELADVVAKLGLERVYGLSAHEGTPLERAVLRLPAALVVGAERAGLSAAARRSVTGLVTIPLAPRAPAAVESLNAATAGAIALYEFARRAQAAAPAAGAATAREASTIQPRPEKET